MSLSKRIFAGAVTLSLLGGGVAAAQAASPTLCPSNRVCLFDHQDYVGLLGYRQGGGGLVSISSGANDKMSSWSNKTGSHGAWYANQNGGGGCYTMHPNTNNRYVGILFNDQASSWRTDRSC